MAILLRAAGHQVTLILLDPILQVPEVVVDGGENLRVLADCDDAYAALGTETSPARAAALRTQIGQLLPMIVAEHQHDVLDEPGLDEVWPVAVRSWRQQIEARLPYRYRTYGGHVHLLACDELAVGIHEGLAGLSFDGYLQRWQGLARAGVAVHRVAGGNITSMLPPHVTDLAQRLATIIREG
jgi:hypothetical protein